MFRIIADSIEYDGRTVARVTIPEGTTLYDQAIGAIASFDETRVYTEKEMDDALNEKDDEWRETVSNLETKVTELENALENETDRANAAEYLLAEFKTGETTAADLLAKIRTLETELEMSRQSARD